MLDVATDGLVLAGIQPDTDTVKTAVNLDAFDTLGRKTTTTFRAR
jgi:hypothetical protein